MKNRELNLTTVKSDGTLRMVRNYKRKTEDRWSKFDLQEALMLIKGGKLKLSDAAKEYGISRATLYRHYRNFETVEEIEVSQLRNRGGSPILSPEEEDALETIVEELVDNGNVVTGTNIKCICFEYCDANGIENGFNKATRMASDDWYYGFLKRHPDVKVSKRRKIEETEGTPGGSVGPGGNVKPGDLIYVMESSAFEASGGNQ